MVEVIIATSIVLVFLVALVGAYSLYLTISLSNIRKVEATFLAEEGVEAVRSIRDQSWDQITALLTGVDYWLVWTGSGFEATTTSGYIDGIYDRRAVFDEVQRNSSSDIVLSGGTADPDTRKVTVTVSWREKNATTTKVISTYLTNLFEIE